MPDLRITRPTDGSRQVQSVASDGGDGQARHEPPAGRKRDDAPTGTEELSVALTIDPGLAIEAHYEEDADGNPLIRIVDMESNETVALMTPEELRAATEQTGLPPGLLLRTFT